MSQFPRRSARLLGLAAEYSVDIDHEVPDGVPMVDLTTSDDIQCSICGLADGILDHFFCTKNVRAFTLVATLTTFRHDRL